MQTVAKKIEQLQSRRLQKRFQHLRLKILQNSIRDKTFFLQFKKNEFLFLHRISKMQKNALKGGSSQKFNMDSAGHTALGSKK